MLFRSMRLGKASNTPNTLHGGLIANMTTQGVTGIGRVNNYAALTNNIHRLMNQALLRIVRVNMKILGHGIYAIRVIYSPALGDTGCRLEQRKELLAFLAGCLFLAALLFIHQFVELRFCPFFAA